MHLSCRFLQSIGSTIFECPNFDTFVIIPKRSLLHLEAGNIFSDLFASTFVYQTVSSTDNKRWQENYCDDKTFTFIQISPLVPLGQPKTGPGRPNHSRAPKWMKTDSLYESKNHKKLTQSPNTPPTPSRLLLPGCWPPLRPPAGLQVGKGWGDLHPRTV